MAEPVVKLVDLTRSFQLGDTEVRALQGVSVSIERGEFVAIMGSSGSGKSTMMNIIGCLDRPTSGEYVFEGHDVARLSEPELADIRSGRIGFVFQSFNLLARTSALENVILPLLYGASAALTSSQRNDRGRELLASVGLADRARNMPNQLSGGQQQRIALARALVNHPAVLLADEPTGNLDTRTSHEIMEIIRRLNRDQGVTVIVVTHESDIAAYADRVIVMRDGRILSDEHQVAVAMPVSADGGAAPTVAATAAVAGPPDGAFGLRLGFLSMIVSASLQALARNKLRSALTMLGVFIGVAALIAMVAVGDGASAAVKKQLESLGTNMVVVQPGATTAGGVRAGAGSASTLTVVDAQTIQRDDPAVQRVSYLTRQAGQVEYGNQNWNTAIQGVTPSYLDIVSWHVASGSAMTEQQWKVGGALAYVLLLFFGVFEVFETALFVLLWLASHASFLPDSFRPDAPSPPIVIRLVRGLGHLIIYGGGGLLTVWSGVASALANLTGFLFRNARRDNLDIQVQGFQRKFTLRLEKLDALPDAAARRKEMGAEAYNVRHDLFETLQRHQVDGFALVRTYRYDGATRQPLLGGGTQFQLFLADLTRDGGHAPVRARLTHGESDTTVVFKLDPLFFCDGVLRRSDVGVPLGPAHRRAGRRRTRAGRGSARNPAPAVACSPCGSVAAPQKLTGPPAGRGSPSRAARAAHAAGRHPRSPTVPEARPSRLRRGTRS